MPGMDTASTSTRVHGPCLSQNLPWGAAPALPLTGHPRRSVCDALAR